METSADVHCQFPLIDKLLILKSNFQNNFIPKKAMKTQLYISTIKNYKLKS